MNGLFDTGDRSVASLWDRFLDLQTDLLFDTERRLLDACPAWRAARHVADLGCGNGRWLERLAAAFPDKRYLGVEQSAELLGMARLRHAGPNIEFLCADLHAVPGRFDALLLRAVLQHVPAPAALPALLCDRLVDGGSLLVLDNDPGSARTHPPAPRTAAAWAAFARRQRVARGGDDPFDALRAAVDAAPGLTLSEDRVAVVPSTLPGHAARFRQQTLVALHLFQAAGVEERPGDLDAAIAEWRAWCAEPKGYVQVGVRFVRVERVGGGAPRLSAGP
jgi:SAM-dependent methyltransferase